MHLLFFAIKAIIGVCASAIALFIALAYFGLEGVIFPVLWFIFYVKTKQYFSEQQEKYLLQIKTQLSQAENPTELFSIMTRFRENYKFQKFLNSSSEVEKSHLAHYQELEKIFSERIEFFQQNHNFNLDDSFDKAILDFVIAKNNPLSQANLAEYSFYKKIKKSFFIIPFSFIIWSLAIWLCVFVGLLLLKESPGSILVQYSFILETSEFFHWYIGFFLILIVIFCINRIFVFQKMQKFSRIMLLMVTFEKFKKFTENYFASQEIFQQKTTYNLILFSKIIYYLMQNIEERKNKLQSFVFFVNNAELKKFLQISKENLKMDAIWTKNVIHMWAEHQIQNAKNLESIQWTMSSEYVQLYLQRRKIYEKNLNLLR